MKAVKDKLVKELSKEHGIDSRIARLISDCPIKFFKKVCSDDEDIRPVRLRYFGIFTPKTSYIKKVLSGVFPKKELKKTNHSEKEVLLCGFGNEPS